MELKIIDNNGFLALVDPNKYASHVAKNWEFIQLISHFIDQSNKGHMIIWRTGNGGDERIVSFLERRSGKRSFREFEGQIEVTDGKLFLTEYADLTMAASFEDQIIPSKHNSALKVDLENGFYKVLIRQLFNPDLPHFGITEHFEVILEKTTGNRINKKDKILWFYDK